MQTIISKGVQKCPSFCIDGHFSARKYDGIARPTIIFFLVSGTYFPTAQAFLISSIRMSVTVAIPSFPVLRIR